MKAKLLLFLVVLCLCGGILAGQVLSATAQKNSDAKWRRHISEDRPVDGAGRQSYREPFGAYGKYLSGTAELACEDIQPSAGTVIQHEQIGDTWYEYQQNNSIGRMISVTDGGYRHFSWMYCSGQHPGNPRYVDANCKDPIGTYIGQVHADGGDVNAGYCNQIYLHDGTSAIVHHRTGGTPVWASVLTVDDSLWSGSFSKHWDLPDVIIGAAFNEEGMWPKAGVTYDAVHDRDYIHIAMTEMSGTSAPYVVAYERCFISPTDPDTLYCQNYVSGATATYPVNVNQNGLGPFGPISHFDSTCQVSPVVAVSSMANRVAIVYTRPACEMSCNYLSDLCYLESDWDHGDSWIDGSNWPPTVHNITDFGCTGTERAYADLNACYDYGDNLHIVYVACGFDPDNPGYYQPGVARLYHWSEESGIRMITSHIQGGADPGSYNCIIAKPSISAQDPIYHPEGDSVYLYTIWTQFDSSDVSAGGYANGDIWGRGSYDGGNTWGKEYNLTNTHTPGCSPGDCVSEHWSSLATNMYDGDLHIQYICDRDAGGAIMDGTPWMSNPVMYLHLTSFSVWPPHPPHYKIEEPPHWYHPPLKVEPGGSRTLRMKLYCVGNEILEYACYGDHECIPEYHQGTLNPQDSVTFEFTVQGGGQCAGTFIDASVVLTVDYRGRESYYLPVQAVVADDYYECPTDPETVDTLDNGLLKLHVNANCEESIHDIGTFPDTTHRIFLEGGTIIATTSGGDTLVGRYMREDRHAGVRDKPYTDECNQDWEPDFWLAYTKNIFMHDFEPPADYKWYWWELSKQVKFFKETAPDVYRHLVIKYVKVRRHNPPGWWPEASPFAGYEDTYVGVLEDIDCPFDSSGGPEPFVADEYGVNEGGYDAANQIAWQRGFGRSGEHPEYNNYYCGIALADADQEGPENIVPYGTYCAKNNRWVYPNQGWGWKNGELYWLASQTGNNIEFPDSILDRSYIFTAAKIEAGDDPDAEASFTVILAAAPDGLSRLQEFVDSARAIVERERGEGYPVVCGDVNGKQGVSPGDIVYLINYLYRGEAPPVCPFNRGDVNSDGTISAADIVYMIGYLWRGGPAPDCPGIWGP